MLYNVLSRVEKVEILLLLSRGGQKSIESHKTGCIWKVLLL